MLTVKTNQNFLQLNINMISYNGSEGFSESPAKRLVIRNHVHQFVRAYCVTLVMSNTFRPCGLQPARLLSPQDSLGKNIGVGYHALLQGIFLTPGSKPYLSHLLHWQVGSLPLAPPGKPYQLQSTSASHAKSVQLCGTPTICHLKKAMKTNKDGVHATGLGAGRIPISSAYSGKVFPQ